MLAVYANKLDHCTSMRDRPLNLILSIFDIECRTEHLERVGQCAIDMLIVVPMPRDVIDPRNIYWAFLGTMCTASLGGRVVRCGFLHHVYDVWTWSLIRFDRADRVTLIAECKYDCAF